MDAGVFLNAIILSRKGRSFAVLPWIIASFIGGGSCVPIEQLPEKTIKAGRKHSKRIRLLSFIKIIFIQNGGVIQSEIGMLFVFFSLCSTPPA